MKRPEWFETPMEVTVEIKPEELIYALDEQQRMELALWILSSDYANLAETAYYEICEMLQSERDQIPDTVKLIEDLTGRVVA